MAVRVLPKLAASCFGLGTSPADFYITSTSSCAALAACAVRVGEEHRKQNREGVSGRAAQASCCSIARAKTTVECRAQTATSGGASKAIVAHAQALLHPLSAARDHSTAKIAGSDIWRGAGGAVVCPP